MARMEGGVVFMHCDNCGKETIHIASATAYDEEIASGNIISVQISIRMVCAICARTAAEDDVAVTITV